MIDYSAERDRTAFMAGFEWTAWKHTLVGVQNKGVEEARAEAIKRYPTKHVTPAPSGRWYAVSGKWRELRGYKSEADARADVAVGSWVGVPDGDENAVAELFRRIAADRAA